MPDYILDRRDLDFLLHEQFDLGALTSIERYSEYSREDFVSVLDAAEKLIKEVLAPTNQVADREGCSFENGRVRVPAVYRDAYRQFAENGWIAVTRPTEYGGMQLPLPLGVSVVEMAIGAASSFYFFPGLSVAAGHLLENFASEELKQMIIPRLYDGRWTGTMCLTEPQAGSAVGDVATTATPIEGSDAYAIKGSKIFISAGDHDITENIVHLVLARVPGDPDGIKGISLFVVPKLRYDAQGAITGSNDVATTAIEHKMGIHGSPTCSLAFGDDDDCQGWLIGERCKGIVYMFQMMNEARIVCGIQGVGLANYAYQLALAYARERVQGTKVTERDPGAKPVPIIEHPDVRRNLMLCKSLSEGIRALLLQAGFHADLAEHHPDPAVRQKSRNLLDLTTPVCKAYATDQGFRVTELAIQILGGYGYVSEYGVEQCMRDVKIASIYEGTNGIQALDLLGRKMRQEDGALFMTWLQEINELIEANRDHATLGAEVAALEKAKNHLAQTAMGFAQQGKEDPEVALLGATPFLEMFGHVEVARLLVAGAIIADARLEARMQQRGVEPSGLAELLAEDEEARFYDGKRQGARFFVATVLPQAIALGKSIQVGDRSALDIVF